MGNSLVDKKYQHYEDEIYAIKSDEIGAFIRQINSELTDNK